MLGRLPVELLDGITARLSLKELKSLSLACKLFHSVCAPRIWKTICVDIPRVKGKQCLFDIKRIADCASALRDATPFFRNATSLVFRRDLRWTSWYELNLGGTDSESEEDADEEREPLPRVACFHPQPRQDADSIVNLVDLEAKSRDRKNQLPIDNMYHLAHMVCSVIEIIPPGQLQSFSWDLATCVPCSVLDTLFARQPHLRSLRMANDVECSKPGGQVLVPFQHLTRISWHGPSGAVLGSLQESLELNRNHLTELEISLGSPIVTEDDIDSDHSEDGYHHWEDPDNHARTPFSQSLPRARPVFPSLTVLSLSKVSIGGKMRQAIDISALKSLTLRQCPMWTQFLKRSVAAKSPICLESFEIKSEEWDDYEEPAVTRLLLSFQGLKDLFIGYHKSIASSRLGPPLTEVDTPANSELWSAIAHHRATLKRLVVHRRGREAGLACRRAIMDYNHDGYDLDIPQSVQDRWKMYPGSHPMSTLELECVGFPYDTRKKSDSLRKVLEPLASMSTLKLLHLRQTGSDFRWRGSRALVYPNEDPSCRYSHDFYAAGPPDKLETMLLPQFAELLDWIFGPTGIPSLEILAFGDFAHGRNGWALHNLFICRSPSGKKYKVFDARDKVNKHEWIDTTDKYRNFLESCPVAPLVDSWSWAGTATIYGF